MDENSNQGKTITIDGSVVLVVDDQPSNLQMIYEVLSFEPVTLLTAQNGSRAIDLAVKEHPDLILLDIMMPDMDGYEVCLKLKNNDDTKDIPIVFISALSEIENKLKGFEVGGVDYITKPFEEKEVLARVTAHLLIKKQQKALQNEINKRKWAEHYTSSMIRNLSVGIITINHTGKIILVEGEAINELGIYQKELMNQSKQILFDRFPEFLAGYNETLEGNKPCIILQKAGRYFQIIFTPVILNEDDIQGVSILINDITELKEREKLIDTYAQELRKSNQDKDQFFSIMAHDLKGPLHGLINLSSILSDSPEKIPTNDLYEIASQINYASKNLYSLIDNLLQWSRIQNKRLVPNPETFSISEAIEKEINLHRINAEKKQISIINAVNSSLTIYADKNMISTVLRNLISNAIKFSPKGNMIAINSDQKETMIHITVSDNGTGIDKKTLDNLFSSDTLLSNPGTAGEKGTGLGLVLVKEFVEMNNGKVTVESEVGKGSHFTISLPTN